MPRRRIIAPLEYLRRKEHWRKVTKCAVGRHHTQMNDRGLITSSPVAEPPFRPRVWIERDDACASLMMAAKVEDNVSVVDISVALGMPGVKSVPHGSLTLLGIVAVPVSAGQVRLVGTSPDVARIANHVHWGLRRRHITAEELIEATLGLEPNGRKTSVTDPRLEETLTFFFGRFEIDFSDVVYRTPVLV